MNEKEKLEKELKFLKETYEAGIITKEEFEKGKKRIEEKLKEPEEEIKIEEVPKEELEKKEIEEFAEEVTNNQEKKEPIEKPAEKVEEKPIETEETKVEEKPIEKVEEETKPEVKPTEEKKAEEQKEEPKSEALEVIKEEPTKINKKSILTISILIVVALILIFFFRIKPTTEEIQIEEETTPTFQPACTTDIDCQKEGKIGTCINPDTKEAECEFKDAIPVSLTIINDKNCLSCDPKTMIIMMKQLFPGVKEIIVDINSEEGEKLADELNIKSLPTFIFDSNITKTYRYNKTKNALIRKKDKYIWSNSAVSGVVYFFKRESMPNKLELYVTNSTLKVEKNLNEVLNLFDNKINYINHLVPENKIIKELGINKNFPVFLVNNQLKFSGILSSEMIKEKFCALNKLEECSTTLSTNIK